MAKELKMMSLKELNELKYSIKDISENYAKQLLTHGISDTEFFYNNLTENEKIMLDKRLKLIKLLSKIDSVIEEKISFYYDEVS